MPEREKQMVIQPDFILRQVMDYYIILGIGSDAYMPNEIMSLNETGAFLWDLLKDGAETKDLIDSLVKEYDVEEQTAAKDVDEFLASLRERGLIEE